MCIGSLFGGGNGDKGATYTTNGSILRLNGDEDKIREEIIRLGGDPSGLDRSGLVREYNRLNATAKNGGASTSLPFVAPPPDPSAKMGLRLPRTPVGINTLKLPRR